MSSDMIGRGIKNRFGHEQSSEKDHGRKYVIIIRMLICILHITQFIAV